MRKIAVTVLVLTAGTDRYSQIQEQPTQIKKIKGKENPLLSSVNFKKGEEIKTGLLLFYKRGEEMIINLTESQCKNLCEFIEFNIFDYIRNDKDIDNIDWLIDMMEAYQKLKGGGIDG